MTTIEHGAHAAHWEPADEGDRIVIWPSRALGRSGSRRLPQVVSTVFAMLAAWALAKGAWPVAVYALLAGAGFAWAIASNNRSGRLQQEIEFAPDCITVRMHGPAAQRATSHEFNPCWVRLVETVDYHTGLRVTLQQSGRTVLIGQFLGVEERSGLAEEIRRKLDRYKQTGDYEAHVR